ncbi:MAG TPA: hypothetical protein VGJ84_15965, partial [Polyangiaceae bacterium]
MSTVSPELSGSLEPTSLMMSPEQVRAEREAANEATARALLLHELALIEDQRGDEAAAARSELAAINEDPELRDPLERLISLIERRGFHKNL